MEAVPKTAGVTLIRKQIQYLARIWVPVLSTSQWAKQPSWGPTVQHLIIVIRLFSGRTPVEGNLLVTSPHYRPVMRRIVRGFEGKACTQIQVQSHGRTVTVSAVVLQRSDLEVTLHSRSTFRIRMDQLFCMLQMQD